MKFLFIYPTSNLYELKTNKYIKNKAHLPPLGLLYISKILENNGHKIEIIDCNAEKLTTDKIKNKIKNFDVVGLSTFTKKRDRDFSIKIAKTIKEIDRNKTIIIGGPHATILPELAIKEHQADICVIGQAENVINMVAEALEGKRELSTIPGIIYKNGTKFKKTKKRDLIENLDDIPFPARHLVEKYDYGYMFDVKFARGKVTTIITSRGCPHHCKFCSLRAVFPKYQERSLKDIYAEIDEIIEQGYKIIAFNDDNFIVNKKRIEKLMDYIISKNADLKLWIYSARADSADRKLFEKMRDAGVEYIFLGIENGNQEILDYYNKKLDLSEVHKTVKLCKEMGFFVMGNFLFGAPIEKRKHFENTIKFAKSLNIDIANFYVLNYPIGSQIRKEAEKQGKIKKDEIYVDAGSENGLSDFSKNELESYTEKAQRNFYFNPKFLLRGIYYSLKRKNFNLLKLGFKWVNSSF